MRGLRTPENSRFIKFFSQVQKEAIKENKTFFLDFGEQKNIRFNDFEIDDLFGWLVPNDIADEFEEAFEKNRIGEEWDEFYTAVFADIKGEELKIKFE